VSRIAHTVDSRPIDMPASVVVAGPVRAASASVALEIEVVAYHRGAGHHDRRFGADVMFRT
jgi:hypothetical protein